MHQGDALSLQLLEYGSFTFSLHQVRWVVESANARIKNWKYLSKTLPTNQVPYIGDYVRIVSAITNKYYPPLSQPTSHSADEAEATKMLHLSQQVNSLQRYIEENNLLRKTSPWKHITNTDLLDFLTLSEDQLRDITCGSYQLKLTSSYIQEHIDSDSDLFFHKDDPTLLRIKIQSRHTSSRKYTVWIRYSNNEIVSWYCLCRAGARVVGVCSHVAAMLWYLGGARFSRKKSYGVRDPGKTVEDAAVLPELIDESESDTDCVEHCIEE